MNANTFTDDNFKSEIIDSKIPVVVDFWATWCGPCKMIAPIIEDLAVKFEGRVKVGKLDVDSNPEASIKYGVRSIPTVLIFKNGAVVDTIIGAVSKEVFSQKIEAVL